MKIKEKVIGVLETGLAFVVDIFSAKEDDEEQYRDYRFL